MWRSRAFLALHSLDAAGTQSTTAPSSTVLFTVHNRVPAEQVETIQAKLNRPSRNSTCSSASKAEGEGGGRGWVGNDRASERERGGDGAEIEGKKRQTQEERAFASDSEAQRQRIRIRAEIRRAQPQLRPCTLRARVPPPSFHDGNPPAGHPGGGPERGTIRDRAERLKTRGKRAGIVKGIQVDGFKVGRSVTAILSRRWR